jgi:hypothetical protein
VLANVERLTFSPGNGGVARLALAFAHSIVNDSDTR